MTASQRAVINQGDLFATKQQLEDISERVPWQFRLKFREKNSGREDDAKVLAWSYYQGFRRAAKQMDEVSALNSVAENIRGSIFNPAKTSLCDFWNAQPIWTLDDFFFVSCTDRDNRIRFSKRRSTVLIKSLFTIGFTGLQLDEFIGQLKSAKIELLLDVREIPISRKRGFSKTSLSENLLQSGIEYRHLKWLGSPKTLRHEVRETRD